ncbi:MAG: hypothetical protein V3U03_17575 [Myxococcota bacterium]
MKHFKATIGGARRVLQELDGAGDVIHEIIQTATGGKLGDCPGCDERRARLNRALPNPFKARPAEDEPAADDQETR